MDEGEEESAEKVPRLLDALEELADVQSVCRDCALPDSVLEA